MGPEKFLSLKPVNMVRSETGPCMEADAKAAAPTPKKEEKKGSLASLLSLGRGPSKEEVKPETWQSVFQRSASDTLQSVTEGHKLTEDDLDYLRSLDRNQERIEEEKTSLRRKVAAELASQGAYDEDMVEELFKQQWEELQLQRLLRPQDSTGLSTSSKLQNRDRSRSRSRSGSSSSSSSNDGDAEETPKAAAED